jgi:hypothetical protein
MGGQMGSESRGTDNSTKETMANSQDSSGLFGRPSTGSTMETASSSKEPKKPANKKQKRAASSADKPGNEPENKQAVPAKQPTAAGAQISRNPGPVGANLNAAAAMLQGRSFLNQAMVAVNSNNQSSLVKHDSTSRDAHMLTKVTNNEGEDASSSSPFGARGRLPGSTEPIASSAPVHGFPGHTASTNVLSEFDQWVYQEEGGTFELDNVPSSPPKYTTCEKWVLDYQKRREDTGKKWVERLKKGEKRIVASFEKLKVWKVS